MTDQLILRTVVAAQIAGAIQPPSALAATWAFAWRSMLKLRHVPEQLGDVLLIPALFTVLFTYMFGGALAGSTEAYLDYLLPGTLAMTVVLITVFTGVGLHTDLVTGAFDRFRSLPIWRPAPFVGAMIGDSARYLVASGIVVGLGLVMGFRPTGGIAGVVAAIGLVLVFAFSLSWVWTAAALVLRSAQAVNVAGLFLLFPLTFVSNVFVRPETMPGWLQTAISLNPMTHLVSAVRGLMSGSPSPPEIAIAVLASLVLVTVFAPLTACLYARRG
jgi:ABC-2 type transport system permease protein